MENIRLLANFKTTRMGLLITAATAVIFINLAISEDNYIKKKLMTMLSSKYVTFFFLIILLGVFKEVPRPKEMN